MGKKSNSDRQPDPTEEIAKAYLKSEHPDSDLVYEPFPSEPPDFLLGDHLAIEVRRLNENITPSPWEDMGDYLRSKPHGLEQDHYKISGALGSCEQKIEITNGRAYWIHIEITGHRPIRLDAKAFSRTIATGYANSTGEAFSSDFDGFKLIWEPRIGGNHSQAIARGWLIDHDSGGWSADVYEKNLQIVIDDKWGKIERFGSDRFAKWWLILVDHVSPHSSFLARYDDGRLILHGFSRVVVIEQNGAVITDYLPH